MTTVATPRIAYGGPHPRGAVLVLMESFARHL